MSSNYDETLELLRRGHEDGDRDAARYALHLCAMQRILMPPWLSSVVKEAIEASTRGRADDSLGFGDGARLKAWRLDWLQSRDWAIRATAESKVAPYVPAGATLKKRALIQAMAEFHHISVKAVEKILYPPRKTPTRRPEK
jgi:hypothetical protein